MSGFDQQESEFVLIQLAQAGDKIAYSEAWDNHASKLYSHVFRMMGNRDEADEIFHDIFIAGWKDLPDLKDVKAFRPWIFRIATNKALAFIQRKKKRQTISWAEEAKLELFEALKDTNLESRVITQLMVRLALEQVTDSYRACIFLKQEGFSPSEIAETLGFRPESVRKMIQRGIIQFRKAYQDIEQQAEADIKKRS